MKGVKGNRTRVNCRVEEVVSLEQFSLVVSLTGKTRTEITPQGKGQPGLTLIPSFIRRPAYSTFRVTVNPQWSG